jgi:threonine dehydrogenase-like Zn-dependent dehydrogenase
MEAVVLHGVGHIRLADVPGPTIEEPTDAIVRLTASAICGSDLYFVRGTMEGVKARVQPRGRGVVDEIGEHVRNLGTGDRVVIPRRSPAAHAPTAAGYYAQCDNANPSGHLLPDAIERGAVRWTRSMRRPRPPENMCRWIPREGGEPKCSARRSAC